jgi:DNA-binding IclR family transcriptional regulator
VRRAFDIIDYLDRSPEPKNAAELSRALRIPRSSVYQIAQTLAARGVIDHARSDGGFTLGRRLHELGLSYQARNGLLQEAQPIVEAVRDETGETAQLVVLDRDEALVVLKADGREPIHVASRVGLRFPINWSAAGRLLLSDLTAEELRRRLPAMVRPSPSGKAPTATATLIREIRAARRQGVAVQLSQSIRHAGAIAAPVIGAAGRCLAALSIVVPVHRLRGARRRKLMRLLKRAAQQLSQRLGADTRPLSTG